MSANEEISEKEACLLAQVAALRLQLGQRDVRIADLERLVDTDPLTGVMNRRGFDKMLLRYAALCRRAGQPVSLVYVDLARFKAINDTVGHAKGDQTLREVAAELLTTSGPHPVIDEATKSVPYPLEAAISGAIRPLHDVVARVGGDEFAILLPNTDEGGVRAVLLRIRAAVNEVPVPGTDGHMKARYAAQTCRGGDLLEGVVEERLFDPPANSVKHNEPC